MVLLRRKKQRGSSTARKVSSVGWTSLYVIVCVGVGSKSPVRIILGKVRMGTAVLNVLVIPFSIPSEKCSIVLLLLVM